MLSQPDRRYRTFAQVRKMLSWCVERGMLEASPAAGLKPPAKEVSRDRVLDGEEVAAIWRACDAFAYPFGPLFKIMLITAQREGEVAGMRWSHLDLKAGLWTLPAASTKVNRLRDVPLSELALEVLASLPRLNSELAFSTTGSSAPSGWSRAKARLDKASKVTDWRLHDL